MLTVNDLSVRYDGVTALDGVSLAVRRGEIVTVIGANGAGKSTLLRTVVGLEKRHSGAILHEDRPIHDLPTETIVGRGISLVPESRELFPSMSCRDNLRAALFLHRGTESFDELVEPVFELFPRLRERLNQRAGTLSGGEQQMLAIGRALMQNPSLLLLDEPSLGLSPNLVRTVFETIGRIQESRRTVVLVEQKGQLALDVADRAYVLTLGRITHEGGAAELRADADVQKLYFGD